VIGAEGEQLGILQSRQALTMAKELGLDLVMVAPTAQPPVCKIIDYGKYKYTQGKQTKENKRKSQDVKGIKISPRIAEHDIQTAVKKTITFLEEGHKVKITCQFRAREVTHPELGRKKLDAIAETVKEYATVERTPTMEGRLMIMILVPRPATKEKSKHAKAENTQDSSKAVQDHGNGEDHAATAEQQPHVPAQERSPEATP
jgi:translation initiation factor IF-3